ncbi:ABC transporter permease [Halalkalibacter sp. APA_J-10(15)]|uniref:ABC transporter permease n=1 Tax=Halalkalibacter sp. APA_J-10(15) TaxID=2933805 RepID=UPI001FF6789C|nr:ABC transporter permease [Halalkalibacter sp. APA_J-10(15)]MCK0473718.1 ABC transporter permease [Halalkalibacter sp. APA_J-10(15)]
MYKQIVRKCVQVVITLFCATLIIFALTHLAPGDPVKLFLGHPGEVAMNDTTAYDDKVHELRSQLGLDQHIAVQYVEWVKRLIRFDLGTSIHTGRSVSSEIAERLPATLLLSICALFIQFVLGMLLGTYSAIKAGKTYDMIIRIICVFLASTPAFVLGLVLIFLFAVTLQVYEISSDASLRRVWLPALILGLIAAPQIIRVTRANMLSELGQIYILSAISKGLPKRRVVIHAMRNVMLPMITIIGLSFTTLVSGAVVIESIFSWPGVGKYALDSVLLHDYPVIHGYAFVMVAIVIGTHLFVDLLYVLFDPRMRKSRETGVVSNG